MHTFIKNILLLKIITIGWQCRVTTNLQFVKNIVSVKHNKAKHNEMRYTYQDDSTKICLLGYLRKWVSQVVHINYAMEKLIYIFAWLYVLSHSVVSNSLQPHGLEPTRFLCPWDSPGKKIGVGCRSLLQRIFPTRDQTWVCCIAGRFFTYWATREAHDFMYTECLIRHSKNK